MSIDLEHFWTIVLLIIPSGVEFLVCAGVSICEWTISYNVFRMVTMYFSLRYMVITSTLDADYIALGVMLDTTSTAPLFIIGWPCFVFFVKNKCLPNWPRDFGSDKYDASLWISIIMSLFCTGLMHMDALNNNLMTTPFLYMLLPFRWLMLPGCLTQPVLLFPRIFHKIRGIIYFVALVWLRLMKVPAWCPPLLVISSLTHIISYLLWYGASSGVWG